MKIKLVDIKKGETEIRKELKSAEIEFVTENEDYILTENHQHKNSLIGKLGANLYILKPEDVLYIKADGNDCICVANNNEYYIKEKIYQIEGLLFEYSFLRVSRSHIINVNMIISITPTHNMKYILTMKNNEKVSVTRSYYYIFKDFLGI